MQKFQVGLIAMLIYCMAFVSCDRAKDMAEDMMKPPPTTAGPARDNTGSEKMEPRY